MKTLYKISFTILLLISFFVHSSNLVLPKTTPFRFSSPKLDFTPPSLRLSPKDSSNSVYRYMQVKLDSIYRQKRDVNKFNGCVLVAKNGKPVFVGAYGYASFYTKDTLTAQSSFQLASVSKTLTSTAILLLKEQGKLSLDDSVQTFFPNFPYHGVTIQHLLSHRTGLPNYLAFCASYWPDKNVLLSNWHVMSIMETYKPKAFAKPNTGFSYSNTNYVILAAIIEKATGMSYKDFMETQIFIPLGMKNSWVFDFNYSGHSNLTYGFDKKGTIDDFTMFDGVVGDKGIYSSVEDMFTFDQALHSGKLISKATQELAYTPFSFERPSRKNYGLGWRLMQQPDNAYLSYHNGWWHSYHTLFHHFKNNEMTVIVLSNRHDRIAYDVDDVYRAVYGLDVLLEADD